MQSRVAAKSETGFVLITRLYTLLFHDRRNLIEESKFETRLVGKDIIEGNDAELTHELDRETMKL